MATEVKINNEVEFTTTPSTYVWTITPQLRYVTLGFKDKQGYHTLKQRLQQLWRSSNGEQKWEDIPTVEL